VSVHALILHIRFAAVFFELFREQTTNTKDGKIMQNMLCSNFSWSRWGVAGVLCAAMLAAPLFALLTPAEAKPPSHAPAWGYRAKHDSDVRLKRRSNSRGDDEDRYVRKSYRRRHHPLRHQHTTKRTRKRRYRTFYRTRRDENGRRYRQYYRVYDR
jgi:hypothetical protein